MRKRGLTIDVYNDPGHGWGKVPISLLQELGIARSISPYSYKRDGFAYLEEDADLTRFIDAMKAQGREVKFRDHTGDKQSKIRNYESYGVLE